MRTLVVLLVLYELIMPAGRVASAQEEVKTIRMKVTAYDCCLKCCGKTDAVTSIGDDGKVCDGVAADPKLLPYRTKLDIPGVGIREVDDTGGAMRKDAKKGITHIDVRMATHAEALKFGVQWLDVKVLR